MNTSQTSHMLSAEQLEAYLDNKLSPEEMTRVQHLLDDCELSREALEGYKLVPGAYADVEDLKRSIAAKSGMSGISWTTITLGVVAVAAISVMFSVFFNQETPVENNVAGTQDQKEHIVATQSTNILSPSEDHFVNPEAKVVPMLVQDLHATTVDSQAVTVKENFVIEPIPVNEANEPIVKVEPVVPKTTEPEYNAQVGFVVDLKVTEYDKYYATPIEVKELQLTGTPAKYETEDGLGDSKEEKDEETVRVVPADQFLREGLIAFRDARYGKCISKMEVLLEHNPDDINALFYTAVSYVKLEMYSKAIPLLDKIILAENNVFDEEAEWYKAIALEGNGDTAAATSLFQKIADDGGFYSKQAANKLK